MIVNKLYRTAIGNYFFPDTPNCSICHTMQEGRFFDKHILDALLPFVRIGSTVIDLGACFGQMAIFFSQRLQELGDGGSVISVEANKESYDVMVKNMAINNCPNVYTYHRAAWDTSGEMLALRQPLGKNKSHGHLSVDRHATENQSVLSLAIDDLELDDVSVMKIDIQGADLHAMRGSVKTIKKTGMHIVFEHEVFLDESFGTSFTQYAEFIQGIGYEIKRELPDRNFLIGPK